MSDVLQELRETHPEMGAALDEITAAYLGRSISREEYLYLLTELRDVRAAQELASNENAMRVLVQAVSLAITAAA